ncbi:MAG: 4Fe-4S binding protein, partial [Pseudomonadota bacterium]
MFARVLRFALSLFLVSAALAAAAPMERAELEALVIPPFSLGEPVNDKGVYEILNSGGATAGYVLETEPLAPLPGFSGAPINILVTLDLEANILDARLIEHNEPIFVSGLGQAAFHKFFEQYKGHSIASTMVVGVPYGDEGGASSLVYLDGVTKATASVRIAHESLLAAALSVAREKMQGVRTGPPAYPIETGEDLTWTDLVEQGIARNLRVTNAELQAAFAGTVWEDDDPIAADEPEETYLDFWIVDIGPPAIARAALSEDTYAELARFLEISDTAEPLLVIETARHGLITEDFVRNTAPDLLSMTQGGFPVAVRDADLIVDPHEDAPEGVSMILRTDRRLGFDPTAEWTVNILATREHGMFRPEIGETTFSADHVTPARFAHALTRRSRSNVSRLPVSSRRPAT